MKKEIRWFSEGIRKETEEYSDETLVRVIEEEAKKIQNFSVISMWFSQTDERHGCIAVDLGEEKVKLDNHKQLEVYEFDLLEEDFSDYTKEAQRIKKMIQKEYKNIKVTSNFR